MKQLFQEVFEYHHQINVKLIAELNIHHGQLPERSLPLFSHVMNAHHVWNSRIFNLPPVGVWDVHTLDVCRTMEDANFRNTQQILDHVDFATMITYRTQKGIQYTNSVRDILFHVNNHTTHHRAQIISDFRQSGINPIESDYIFYKR